jgi:hypothetical protein
MLEMPPCAPCSPQRPRPASCVYTTKNSIAHTRHLCVRQGPLGQGLDAEDSPTGAGDVPAPDSCYEDMDADKVRWTHQGSDD